MTSEKHEFWATMQLMVHGTVYLVLVFVAGLMLGSPAWKLALLSLGTSYLSAIAQGFATFKPAIVTYWIVCILFGMSITFGALAGVLLLMVKP